MCQVSAGEIAMHKARMQSRPKRVSIEQAKNGGYIVEHEGDEYPRPKHTFNSHKEMTAHLEKHFGAKK